MYLNSGSNVHDFRGIALKIKFKIYPKHNFVVHF